MTLRSALDELEAMGVIEHSGGRKRRVSHSRSSLLANTVGIISPRNLNPRGSFFPTEEHFTQVNAEITLQEAGYHILVLHPDTLQGANWKQVMSDHPAGLLWTADAAERNPSKMVLETAKKAGISIVVNSDNPVFSEVDRVVSDHEQGGADIVRWLIEHDCKRFAAISSLDLQLDWWERRIRGAQSAASDAGLGEILNVDCTFERNHPPGTSDQAIFNRSVRQMVGFLIDLFQSDKPVDAILAVNDPDAIRIAAACKLLGKEPGKDVKIAGYDNFWHYCIEYTFEPTPPSVTVDRENLSLGYALASQLLTRLNEPMPTNSSRIVVPHTLVACE